MFQVAHPTQGKWLSDIPLRRKKQANVTPRGVHRDKKTHNAEWTRAEATIQVAQNQNLDIFNGDKAENPQGS